MRLYLPDKIYFGIMRYEHIIKLVFLLFIFTTGAEFVGDIAYLISNGLLNLFTKIPGFEVTEINMFFYRFNAIFTGGGNTI